MIHLSNMLKTRIHFPATTFQLINILHLPPALLPEVKGHGYINHCIQLGFPNKYPYVHTLKFTLITQQIEAAIMVASFCYILASV